MSELNRQEICAALGPLRLAPELRQKLDAAAKKSGRSLQSEILVRLNSTLDQDAGQAFTNTSGAPGQLT